MKTRLSIALSLISTLAFAQVSVSSLKTNHLAEPMGISPDTAPVLSWVIDSPVRNTRQTAYELEVSAGGKKVWSSGRVESDNSTCVAYEGPLAPDTRYKWSVKIWDNHGKSSKAQSASWTTGLRPDGWEASWVGSVDGNKSVRLRGKLTPGKNVKRATAYFSSHGLCEISLNGSRIDTEVLRPDNIPAINSMPLLYQSCDVSRLLVNGCNQVEAELFPDCCDDLLLLFQVNVEYSDGSKDCLKSDENWEMTVDGSGKWVPVEAFTLPCDKLIPACPSSFGKSVGNGFFSCSDAELTGFFNDVKHSFPEHPEVGFTSFRTASFLGDAWPQFSWWMNYIGDSQMDDGSIPLDNPICCAIIPWEAYQAYGDISILQDSYPTMKALADHLLDQCHDYLADSDNSFEDQCLLACCLQIVSQTAELLGNSKDAAYCSAMLSKVKTAFLNEYVSPNGAIFDGSQNAYTLALKCRMIPSMRFGAACDRLAAAIARQGGTLTTDGIASSYIFEILTDNGHSDVAARLWKGCRTEAQKQAFCDWLLRDAVGIRETSPGYKTFRIQPHAVCGTVWMEASTVTPYGQVAAKWQAANNDFTSIEVTIPVNTTAEVILPNYSSRTVKCDDRSVRGKALPAGMIGFNLGSGTYRFTIE